MSLQITCPLPPAIGNLTPVDCPENFGQIVKIAFERLAGGGFTDAVDAATEASWDTKIAAADDTKVQISSFVENVLIPAGEAITEGGDDNTTLFGQALVVGKGQVTVTGRFRGLPSQNKVEYEQFLSESAIFGNIGVYLINEFGQLIARETAAVTPFPISSFFISDVDSQGFNTNNFNNFQWNFRGGWSDDFSIITPTFDLLSK